MKTLKITFISLLCLASSVVYSANETCSVAKTFFDNAGVAELNDLFNTCVNLTFKLNDDNNAVFVIFDKKSATAQTKCTAMTVAEVGLYPCIDGSLNHCIVKHASTFDQQLMKCKVVSTITKYSEIDNEKGDSETPNLEYQQTRYIYYVDEPTDGNGVVNVEATAAVKTINDTDGEITIEAWSHFDHCIVALKKDLLDVKRVDISGVTKIGMCVYGNNIEIEDLNLSVAQIGIDIYGTGAVVRNSVIKAMMSVSSKSGDAVVENIDKARGMGEIFIAKTAPGDQEGGDATGAEKSSDTAAQQREKYTTPSLGDSNQVTAGGGNCAITPAGPADLNIMFQLIGWVSTMVLLRRKI